jgi:peptidyl-prolyl cis-trans isomerase C
MNGIRLVSFRSMTSASVAALACVAAFHAAPAEAEEPAKDAAVATYSGKTYTVADFDEAVMEVSPRARKTLEDAERRHKFVENTILSELIYDKGKSEGLQNSEEVRKQLQQLERRLVIQLVMQEQQAAPVPEEDVRAYYDTHKDEFSTERVQASHILVSEEELARDLYAQLQKDPSKFAELAKEHSVDRSNSARGGDLGFFGRGRMVKEFEDIAFALPEDGALSEPIKTRFGWHIIKRESYDPGKVKEFSEVESQIKVRLVNEKRAEVTQAFLDKLKEDAGLTINDEVLAAVALPERGKKDETPEMPAGH